MESPQEMRLVESLKLIDTLELKLMSIEALVTSKWRETIENDEIAALLQEAIDKCHHDI